MKFDTAKFNKIRNAILSFNTRLIDRQLYLTVFENQRSKQLIKAILSYQNEDGGFGNGIEPDFTTPESSAIGLETALYYFDCISELPKDTAKSTVSWIVNQVQDNRTIKHPTPNLEKYPHQPWWKNNDDQRILAIAGLLQKLNVDLPAKVKGKIYHYAENFSIPEEIQEYDYPIFLFSLYCIDFNKRDKILAGLQEKIIDLNTRKPEHFLLFSRYWKFFYQLGDKKIISREIERFIQAINDNGLLPIVYDKLPWWNSIFTLDSIVTLRQYNGFLKIKKSK